VYFRQLLVIALDVRRELSEAIDRLCMLDDPARRATYLAVRAADHPITRAEAADSARISVRLATFHLEKLLAAGFLEATYERAETSIAVGHPAKRYRPTDLELEVSIPPRRYDLAAEILAEAFDEVSPDRPRETLAAISTEYGRQIGKRVRARDGDSRLVSALQVLGYEPSTNGSELTLRNCPFQRAAEATPEVICAMNQGFIAGVLIGVQARTRHAELAPTPGRCCVVVTR
jgi:predicted ArsR family transcriptional regulator